MSARFSLPLVVRTYEVDASRRVLPATYLRWFQEAAIGASAARGFDEERYRQLGATWVLREFHLELLAPLAAGDEVRAYTWVADFRRSIAFRQYRLVRTDGTVAANAEGTWVYINLTTGRPRRLHPELLERFVLVDEYALEDRTWGEHLLDGASPPEEMDRVRHTVRWSELDGAGHVNNAVYAAWATDQLMAACGEKEGAIRRLRLRYRRPVRGGEQIEWRLWPVGERLWMHRAVIAQTGDVAVEALIEMAD